MADKPILFSAPMVGALLTGTKTQTRRLIRQPEFAADGCQNANMGGRNDWWEFYRIGSAPTRRLRLPIAVRDRLYVREHWRTGGQYDHLAPRDLPSDWAQPVEYLADGGDRRNGRFRHGMHMPRWASRITLTVTDVRVQRLHEIGEEDAAAEGADCNVNGGPNSRAAYCRLWNTINGQGSWDANPWVAAYTFTVALGNIDQIGGV